MYIYIDVCVCVCNRIHHVYAHFSSSAVVAHRQGKYLGLASVLQYSHYYSFHSFSPSLPLSLFSSFSLCVRIVLLSQKGLLYWWVFYYDYISLLLSPSFSLSLFFLSRCSSTRAIKKPESELRTNESRKALSLSLSLFTLAVLLYNQSLLRTGNVLSSNIHCLQRHTYLSRHISFSPSPSHTTCSW